MAHRSAENEKVKYRVHVFPLVKTVKHCSRDITHALCQDPQQGCQRDTVYQRFECYQHTQAHPDKTDGLQVAVVFETNKTGNGSCQGTGPYEYEYSPSPTTVFAQCYQYYWRVRACNMPIYGRMVPFTQPFFPFGICRQRVIDGRGGIRHQHTEQI